MRDRTFIIAEAGVNHNGSVETALQMVDVAADVGADCIKFQTFKADRLATPNAALAPYQRSAGEASSSEMLKRLELSEDAHRHLLQRCEERHIEFCSTPFDQESLDFLVRGLRVRRIKVPSGEITNGPHVLAVARTGLPILLSTGMSTIEEIEAALRIMAFGFVFPEDLPTPSRIEEAYRSSSGQAKLRDTVTLLQCTTEYPAAMDQLNLRAMRSMGERFKLPYGFSDHSHGITADIVAVALGARVIEKHFTLDRSQPGPDHRASLEPAELRAMVAGIRQAEQCLGDPNKSPTAGELTNQKVARKSLVAAQPIRSGERFTVGNLKSMRPGGGLSPMQLWDLLGRAATRDYAPDEMIES